MTSLFDLIVAHLEEKGHIILEKRKMDTKIIWHTMLVHGWTVDVVPGFVVIWKRGSLQYDFSIHSPTLFEDLEKRLAE